MTEQRKYPRLSKQIPIKLSWPEFDIVTETRNISANGVYCDTDKALIPMTKLDIVLLLSSEHSKKKIKKINCQGIVVRKENNPQNSKHPYSVAIYFNDLNDKDRKALTSYIETHLQSATK